MSPCDKDELLYWLALLRAPGLGTRGAVRLLEVYGSPRAIFDHFNEPSAGAGRLSGPTLDFLQHPDWDTARADREWLWRLDAAAVPLDHPHYPPLLRQICDPPLVLFVKGAISLLSRPQLAIVGSRNPTAQGRDTAQAFARHLATAGLVITSGLAVGIDAATHRGALAAGGITVAVVGAGLDGVYPPRHRALADRIVECGALVSEFPPGTPPRPEHFPRRNRVISGLSLGTLVVEAAARSGSLITARYALEQGREVFAIPGSIHNPLSRGCHALIREGATLVESVDDIGAELGALSGYVLSHAAAADGPPATSPIPGRLTASQHRLLDILGFDPIPLDVLVERSGLTPEDVSSMLLVLELQGYVVADSGGRFCRNKA